MKNALYVQKAPNGDWLVLEGGKRDRLVAVRKTQRAAKVALALALKEV